MEGILIFAAVIVGIIIAFWLLCTLVAFLLTRKGIVGDIANILAVIVRVIVAIVVVAIMAGFVLSIFN